MQTQHCREGAAPSRPGHVLLHSWPSDKISSLVLLLLLLKQCTQNFFKNLCLCFCSGHIHLNLYVAYIKGNERILKQKLWNLMTCLIMEQSFLSYTITQVQMIPVQFIQISINKLCFLQILSCKVQKIVQKQHYCNGQYDLLHF